MSSEARPVVACIKRIEQCQSERLGSDRITGFTGHAKTPRGPSCMMSGGRRQVVSPPIAHHADRHASTQALWQAQAHGRQAVWGCTWLPKWKYIDTRPIRAACRSAGAHTVHPRHPIQHRRRRGQRGPRSILSAVWLMKPFPWRVPVSKVPTAATGVELSPV